MLGTVQNLARIWCRSGKALRDVFREGKNISIFTHRARNLLRVHPTVKFQTRKFNISDASDILRLSNLKNLRA